MNKPPILCLDFDGVLHSYTSKYTKPHQIHDDPTPGAKEALELYLQHFTVNVFSSRSHQLGGMTAMYEWCRDNFGLEIAARLEFPYNKPPALVSLDDRALTFTGTWPDLPTLKSFRPWNKK